MLDFYTIKKTFSKRSGYKIEPSFSVVRKSKDLMTRGGKFYAIWDEDQKLWSTEETDVQRIIDDSIHDMTKDLPENFDCQVKTMRDFGSGKWLEWQRYSSSLPDNYHELDAKILFSNDKIKKEDYATRSLSYPMKDGPTPNYDELMSVLYSKDNLQKLEWAMGSIIAGDSKKIQKFIVLYGPPGTGKSTFLNVVQDMFNGYYGIFNAKNLGAGKDFALETLKSNPLFAIEHDGDLSKIEDNTILNSIVSHEKMEMNEKFKNKYSVRLHTFLFLGTNKPVRITDAKSGILRRLIDVYPTGDKLPIKRYEEIMKQLPFEYSGIAYKFLSTYKKLGPNYYNDYIPTAMMGETNDVYNFVAENYDFFSSQEDIPLQLLWSRYKDYAQEANIPYPLSMRAFKIEMKEYFRIFKERSKGRYSVYADFKREKFDQNDYDEQEDLSKNTNPSLQKDVPTWLHLSKTNKSELDDIAKDQPAQYATEGNVPEKKWSEVNTALQDLDTRRTHFVKLQESIITIDFDKKDSNGKKSLLLNLQAASSFPPTYAETSMSGNGLHLHYYFDGDPSILQPLFDTDIEIKVQKGNAALRRKLFLCNDIPIATISSGLPTKRRQTKMLSDYTLKNEQHLRSLIAKALRREIHPNTKPSMDMIYKLLTDAYESGIHYDLTDMRPNIQHFAMSSTNQADYCMRLLSKMPFTSKEPEESVLTNEDKQKPICFYDVEVYPNLFVICYMLDDQNDDTVTALINPTPEEVSSLRSYRLIGFNNRRYDNHILYARMMGYSNQALFSLSQQIITEGKGFFKEAYNLSYTDIYDYSTKKQSLKKWEVELRTKHKEMSIPWDKPVPETLWQNVVSYCKNDVRATKAVFHATETDFKAREILAEIAGLTPNDTTNALTTRIIIGNDKNPHSKYIYTDLSTIFPGYEFNPYGIDKERYLPGTKIVKGKSIYLGKDPGEGGYAIGYPGIYYNVYLLDVASMHPHSAIRLKIFGETYTKRYEDLVNIRILIKHGDFTTAKTLLGGALAPYLDDPSSAKELANALKLAINSVYGLTSASFEHPLRDPRNKDNIVAKYGALFMMTLENEINKRGGTVVHIKTDSIKLENPSKELLDFCFSFAKEYGFTFEHEATYERMCLLNDAVYIAKDAKDGSWHATGKEFQVPYIFKTLFSKEPLILDDYATTFSCQSALYLDFNENLPDDKHDYHFIGKVGSFIPVKKGANGGILLREIPEDKRVDNKYAAAAGTLKKDKLKTPYRFLETDMIKELHLEDQIDTEYFISLANEAIADIEVYDNFDLFVSGQIPNLPDPSQQEAFKMAELANEEELPFL